MDFRILVTGTRENSTFIEHMVRETLNVLVHSENVPQGRQVIIVHGQCPRGGVDYYADSWARENGFQPERHPADWKKHGKAAGPVRNTAMVASRIDYCVGFPAAGSRGTWDCLQKAVDAGIPTEVHVIGQLPQPQ